ncbi:MAG: hypothetical protein DI604_18635, partial [Delftia acidovorans]
GGVICASARAGAMAAASARTRSVEEMGFMRKTLAKGQVKQERRKMPAGWGGPIEQRRGPLGK